jgi:hypothetical protein
VNDEMKKRSVMGSGLKVLKKLKGSNGWRTARAAGYTLSNSSNGFNDPITR